MSNQRYVFKAVEVEFSEYDDAVETDDSCYVILGPNGVEGTYWNKKGAIAKAAGFVMAAREANRVVVEIQKKGKKK